MFMGLEFSRFKGIGFTAEGFLFAVVRWCCSSAFRMKVRVSGAGLVLLT